MECLDPLIKQLVYKKKRFGVNTEKQNVHQ